jgi:hypothetical protein
MSVLHFGKVRTMILMRSTFVQVVVKKTNEYFGARIVSLDSDNNKCTVQLDDDPSRPFRCEFNRIYHLATQAYPKSPALLVRLCIVLMIIFLTHSLEFTLLTLILFFLFCLFLLNRIRHARCVVL